MFKLKQLKWYLRVVSAFLRINPDFIIIGAARSGTTSMFKYLGDHPQILNAQKKEPNYFSFNYGLLNYVLYKAVFPAIITKIYQKIKRSGKIISGESSTYYLFYPHTPERVFKKFPNIKIIIMLRNPVDRALSHYKLNVKLKREDLSFEDAINSEEERIREDCEKLSKDKKFDSMALHYYSYLERGKYYYQIMNWLKYFSEDQIKIILSEEFFKTPQKIYSDLLDFLNIEDHTIFKMKIHSKTNYNPMEKHLRERLNNYFKLPNEKLFKLINKINIWTFKNTEN